MITVWWSTGPRPGNLGDVLTPVLLERMGVPFRRASRTKADLLATGSIIRFAQAGQAVWGSGAMFATDRPSPGARYLAVRGPLTRDVVLRRGGDCPEIYGDPALLLPTVYAPPTEKRHEIGLVPHYVDAKDPQVRTSDLPIINPLRADPLNVVDEIRSCHAILSSSLHGIIVAHAYGIPAAWVRLGDRLDGDDTKFRDYAASVGIELPAYRSLSGAVPVLPEPFDPEPLMAALPVGVAA